MGFLPVGFAALKTDDLRNVSRYETVQRPSVLSEAERFQHLPVDFVFDAVDAGFHIDRLLLFVR